MNLKSIFNKSNLRKCLGLSIVLEFLFLLLVALVNIDAPHTSTRDQEILAILLLVIICTLWIFEVYVYQKFYSLWDKWGIGRKLLLVGLAIVPLVLLWWMLALIAVAVAVVVGIILIALAVSGGWNPVKDQANYIRKIEDAKMRGNIEEIRQDLDHIKRNL